MFPNPRGPVKFIHSEEATKFCEISIVDLTGTKAKLQKEGICFLVQLYARDINKKVGNRRN